MRGYILGELNLIQPPLRNYTSIFTTHICRDHLNAVLKSRNHAHSTPYHNYTVYNMMLHTSKSALSRALGYICTASAPRPWESRAA